MPQPPLAPKTSNSHSRPWLQCRSGPQPSLAPNNSPLAPNNSPLAPTISPLALAAIGQMALVSNLSSTSADVVIQLDTSAIRSMTASTRDEMALVSVCTTTSADDKERLDTSAIRPMAASARGEMVGARCELLGARGGCGTDLHCSHGRLWLLEVFGARDGCGTYGPYLGFNFRLWVSISQNVLN